MREIKKVIISVMALAMGLSLVLSVIIPILSHTKDTGDSAYQEGKRIGPSVEEILK